MSEDEMMRLLKIAEQLIRATEYDPGSLAGNMAAEFLASVDTSRPHHADCARCASLRHELTRVCDLLTDPQDIDSVVAVLNS